MIKEESVWICQGSNDAPMSLFPGLAFSVVHLAPATGQQHLVQQVVQLMQLPSGEGWLRLGEHVLGGGHVCEHSGQLLGPSPSPNR